MFITRIYTHRIRHTQNHSVTEYSETEYSATEYDIDRIRHSQNATFTECDIPQNIIYAESFSFRIFTNKILIDRIRRAPNHSNPESFKIRIRTAGNCHLLSGISCFTGD